MSYPPKPRYKTSNWRTYNQALKQRGSLMVCLEADMEWEAKPSDKRGRQQVYSGKEDQQTVRGTVCPTNAIQACLSFKVLLGLPLRQATGFVESLLALSGLSWSVPIVATSVHWTDV